MERTRFAGARCARRRSRRWSDELSDSPAACGCSSATTPTSPARPRSRPISRRCIGPSGSSIANRPFAGPQQVLAYLSRYTHRVAISNSRLIAADATGVTFSYKDYRIEGPGRYKTMTLKPDEFIRRFLMHDGFHRIRHYGLLASGTKTETIGGAASVGSVFAAATPAQTAPTQPAPDNAAATDNSTNPCPCCGGRMITIETFKRGSTPQHRPTGPIIAVRIDTS